MNKAARELLEKLLASAERSGSDSAVLPITAGRARAYFRDGSADTREAIHSVLRDAVAAGAVELVWDKYEKSNDLKQIRLRDTDALAALLGKPRATTLLAALHSRLDPLLRDAPEWIAASYQSAREKWRVGDKAHGCTADELAAIELLYRALLAVERGEHTGLDLRSFSAAALGDSKAMERMQARFCAAWRGGHPQSELDNAELLESLGLGKFPQLALCRGPLRLSYSGSELDIAPLRPFIALSPEAIDAVRVDAVDYLLTIENLASFQRHVREIDDRGVVIYSGGFPGPGIRRLLALLDAALPANTPCFHWGDVDLGGLKIFAHIEAQLARHSLRPHLMAGDATGQPFSDSERRQLEKLADGKSAGAQLARGWIAASSGKIEQENLVPRSPDRSAARLNHLAP